MLDPPCWRQRLTLKSYASMRRWCDFRERDIDAVNVEDYLVPEDLDDLII